MINISKRAQDILSWFLLIVISIGFFFYGIDSFGIWEPEEIGLLEKAQGLLESREDLGELSYLKFWLTKSAIDLFGFTEFGSRFFFCLFAVLGILITFICISHLVDKRTAWFAVIILGSSPLFFLHSKQITGDIIYIVSFGLAILCFAVARWKKKAYFYLFVLIGLVLGTLERGFLLGSGMPLLVMATTQLLTTNLKTETKTNKIVFVLTAVISLAIVGLSLWFSFFKEDPEWELIINGGIFKPRAFKSFEYFIEHIGFGMFPLSALLPFALLSLLSDSRKLRQVCSLFFVATVIPVCIYTFWVSRYGLTPFGGVIILASILAIFLRDMEKDPQPHRIIGFLGTILFSIFARDFLLYPDSLLKLFAPLKLSFPEGMRIVFPLQIFSLVFGISLFFIFIQGQDKPYQSFLYPLTEIPKLWQRQGWKGRRGVVIGFSLWGLLILNAVALFFLSQEYPFFIPFIGVVFSILIALIPVIAILGMFLFKGLGRFFYLIRKKQVLVLLGITGCFGIWGVHCFVPELSFHFSPRCVFDTYKKLRQNNERLARYWVYGKALDYYSKGELTKLNTRSEFLKWMQAKERVFVIIPSQNFASLNQSYRETTRRHLHVLDFRSSKVALVSNILRANEKDQNPLLAYVKSKKPQIQFPLKANYDNKIEYLGYDLNHKDPTRTTVKAGQKITITYYWKCLQRLRRNYKVFVHIDGYGLRLNGDHLPVQEKLSTSLWLPGDYIIDELVIRVPGHFRPGEYIMYIGFFIGSERLPVLSGPHDGQNRIRAGIIRIH